VLAPKQWLRHVCNFFHLHCWSVLWYKHGALIRFSTSPATQVIEPNSSVPTSQATLPRQAMARSNLVQ
jgi:hypothetical protein